jgi:hypothetical protein
VNVTVALELFQLFAFGAGDMAALMAGGVAAAVTLRLAEAVALLT